MMLAGLSEGYLSVSVTFLLFRLPSCRLFLFLFNNWETYRLATIESQRNTVKLFEPRSQYF